MKVQLLSVEMWYSLFPQSPGSCDSTRGYTLWCYVHLQAMKEVQSFLAFLEKGDDDESGDDEAPQCQPPATASALQHPIKQPTQAHPTEDNLQ